MTPLPKARLSPEQKRAVERWKEISEKWDAPQTDKTSYGLCWTACEGDAILPSVADEARVDAFRPDDESPNRCWVGGPGEARPLRSTVAALIAAMIETGDDPADWKEQP